MAEPAVTLAAAELCFGDPARTRPLLATARALDGGEEATGPRRLNGFADELAAAGQLESAASLLRIAIELHPGVANLYDSLGELEAKAGHTDAAIAADRKALELDAKSESASSALKALERLGL